VNDLSFTESNHEVKLKAKFQKKLEKIINQEKKSLKYILDKKHSCLKIIEQNKIKEGADFG